MQNRPLPGYMSDMMVKRSVGLLGKNPDFEAQTWWIISPSGAELKNSDFSWAQICWGSSVTKYLTRAGAAWQGLP